MELAGALIRLHQLEVELHRLREGSERGVGTREKGKVKFEAGSEAGDTVALLRLRRKRQKATGGKRQQQQEAEQINMCVSNQENVAMLLWSPCRLASTRTFTTLPPLSLSFLVILYHATAGSTMVPMKSPSRRSRSDTFRSVQRRADRLEQRLRPLKQKTRSMEEGGVEVEVEMGKREDWQRRDTERACNKTESAGERWASTASHVWSDR